VLGILAPIACVAELHRRGERLEVSIEIAAFADEEGARYPVTLHSSLACAGSFTPGSLDMTDAAGVTLRDAITQYGKNAADIPAAAIARDEAAAYVEVHIEQGPVLEHRNQPLGVVSSIAGQSHLNVALLGEAGHAGTVPMLLRRDALAGAAEIILLTERLARETRGEVVATVGHLNISAAASNVIAGDVALIVDIRSGSDVARAQFTERFKAETRAVAERRHLGLLMTTTRDVAMTPCDPVLQEGFAAAVTAVGGEPLRLASGAGHDGTAMAKLCPIGMLFVRCRGGISHNPAEYASPADMGLAIAALIKFIEGFKV